MVALNMETNSHKLRGWARLKKVCSIYLSGVKRTTKLKIQYAELEEFVLNFL